MLIPDKAYRQFNTWIGDPARVVLSKAVIGEILDKRLVEQCVGQADKCQRNLYCIYQLTKRMQARVGDILYAELEKLAQKYPEYIQNLRGKGYG